MGSGAEFGAGGGPDFLYFSFEVVREFASDEFFA